MPPYIPFDEFDPLNPKDLLDVIRILLMEKRVEQFIQSAANLHFLDEL